MDLKTALSKVEIEVDRATRAHAPMATRHDAYAVLLEEVDEFWTEVKKNPAKMNATEQTAWRTNMRDELVQIAAMAVRSLTDLRL